MSGHLLSRPPLARMVRVHELLAQGKPVNCTRIALEVEVSTKTIQRDVSYMRDVFGLPIEYEPTTHRYTYTAPVDSAIFGRVGKTALARRHEASHGAFALPLDDEPAGYLATICERHGVRAEHVLRAILGEALADAVCNPGVMSNLVRAARMLAVDGREAI